MAGTASDCGLATSRIARLGRSAHAVTRNTQGEVIDKHVEGQAGLLVCGRASEIFTDELTEARKEGISTPKTSNSGMAVIIPGQGEFG